MMTQSLERTMLRKSHLLAAILCLAASDLSAQSMASVELRGPKGQRRVVAATEIAAIPHREVTASAHHVSGLFAGVMLGDLLRLVEAPNGDSLRGPALASYVLVEAVDGYRVIFALAELNASFTDRLILLVDRKDGAPLSDRDGPFQLIVPDEKRPARWVRQVKRISVVQLPAAANP